jgi:HTH-type transcriptional regulator / antitoxin HigA
MIKINGKPIAVPGDPKKYGSLLSQTLPAIIETEEQNEQYLAVVEKLMRKGEDNLSPEEETLLKLLVHLISDFEHRYYKPRKASPVEVLRELMAANDLKQADLVPIFGSKGITSEVINGKRGISKAHAKALGKFFNISPAAFI